MPRISAIQLKALFMLVTFTASFTVFCHCAKAAVPTCCHSTCCEKNAKEKNTKEKGTKEKNAKEKSGAQAHKPDSRDCHGMQAVRFNLLEKQTADQIHPAPAPLIMLEPHQPQTQIIALRDTPQKTTHDQWSYKHSPPDLQALYQCFLI